MNTSIRKKFILIVIPLAIILSLASYFLPAYFFNKTQIQAPNVLDTDTAEAQPGIAAASPSIITLNEPSEVTITIEITDTRLIPTSVNLQRLDETGKAIAILGNLNDSGTNGDTLAGDKIFSTTYTFAEATTTPVYLRVSWALKGVLRRVASNTLTVEVWRRVVELTKGINVSYPPNWKVNDKLLSLGGPVNLNTFSSIYHHGGVIPQNGAEVSITTTSLEKTTLTEVMTRDSIGATIQATNLLSVAGTIATQVAYLIPFAPSTTTYSNVIVYVLLDTTLYKLSLLYHTGDPREDDFLRVFEQILTTVKFTP